MRGLCGEPPAPRGDTRGDEASIAPSRPVPACRRVDPPRPVSLAGTGIAADAPNGIRTRAATLKGPQLPARLQGFWSGRGRRGARDGARCDGTNEQDARRRPSSSGISARAPLSSSSPCTQRLADLLRAPRLGAAPAELVGVEERVRIWHVELQRMRCMLSLLRIARRIERRRGAARSQRMWVAS